MKRFSVFFIFILSTAWVSAQSEHLHHIFPNEFKHIFEQLGINNDDFTIKVSASKHLTNHKAYNQNWENFLSDQNTARLKNLTNTQREKELIRFAEQNLSQTQNIRGNHKFYNYSSRNQSGAKIAGQVGTLTTGAGGFLAFCSKIARFLIRGVGAIAAFFISIGVSIAAFFGFQVSPPVGLIIGIIAILLLIGFIIFFMWILWVIVGIGGVLGVGGAASSSG